MESMKVSGDFSLHSNAISQAAAKNSFGTYIFLNTMHVFALLLLRLTYCNLLLNNRLLDNPFITFKPNVKKLRILIYTFFWAPSTYNLFSGWEWIHKQTRIASCNAEFGWKTGRRWNWMSYWRCRHRRRWPDKLWGVLHHDDIYQLKSQKVSKNAKSLPQYSNQGRRKQNNSKEPVDPPKLWKKNSIRT